MTIGVDVAGLSFGSHLTQTLFVPQLQGNIRPLVPVIGIMRYDFPLRLYRALVRIVSQLPIEQVYKLGPTFPLHDLAALDVGPLARELFGSVPPSPRL